MLSVAGLETAKLKPLCKQAINFLKDMAEKAGALQAKVLKTGGAFHTPLMQPAQDALSAAIDEIMPNMKPPLHTIWMNASAEPVRPGCDVAEIVANMKKQLTMPVYWAPSVQEI